ncbi:TPA: hypothetical protein ACXIJW_004701 [Serratia marcescens]|uniref:hypothetical protein n=1 Tax=Serratia sp. CC22-02 TaxID=1378076 RepID=UPI0024035F79|nr:hypothetical protein [Serratia sp. CC22-02]SMP62831.1 hypothetical protein SAMN02744783_02420 [Serratia sp. CC22-02]
MSAFILRVAFLFIITPLSMAYGYESWVGPNTPYLVGSVYEIRYDYAISDNGLSPAQNAIIPNCYNSDCVFAPIPRTGLGPSANLCDSGGVCIGSAVKDGVRIRAGTTWREAFELFIKKYGQSGTFSFSNWLSPKYINQVAWEKMCVGFAAIPSVGINISVLAPDASCGSVPKPTLQCTVNIPGALDLGAVTAGITDAAGNTSGNVECNSTATLTGSLLNNPKIDGYDVVIEINNRIMERSAITIGTGMSVPLRIKATIRGTLNNTGNYSSDAVLQISYY